jgi:hypothetical protein
MRGGVGRNAPRFMAGNMRARAAQITCNKDCARQELPIGGKICLASGQGLPSGRGFERFKRAFLAWHGTSYAWIRHDSQIQSERDSLFHGKRSRSIVSKINENSSVHHIHIFGCVHASVIPCSLCKRTRLYCPPSRHPHMCGNLP